MPTGKPRSKHAVKDGRTFIDPYVAAAIRLLLLTGARVSEIFNLEWTQVDLERRILFLPDSKTGEKEIVLNSAAVTILKHLPHVGAFVIPGKLPGKPRTTIAKPWGTVLRRAGIPTGRIHDLRHTNASFGINRGVGLYIIGKLLGHASGETTKRYLNLEVAAIRRGAERIGRDLSQALRGAGSSFQ